MRAGDSHTREWFREQLRTGRLDARVVELEGRDRKQAQAALKQAADKLLANTLIENYQVELK